MSKETHTTHKEDQINQEHENELSNIEPMSSLQKAIIGFALFCVIGAIVYCVFFMR